MNNVLKIFLSLSLSGSLLILVLFLCKPILKDKLSKRWQYYIGLVVIARLRLSFAPETNLMGNAFQSIEDSILQTDLAPPSSQSVRKLNTFLVKYLWMIWLVVEIMLIIRIIGREINKACKNSCVETIIVKLNYYGAQDYGNTLLNEMATVGK